MEDTENMIEDTVENPQSFEIPQNRESFAPQEAEFEKHHKKQVESKSQKDIFFIWMLIVFISVIAAHFVLNIAGGNPTGFVTAADNPATNTTILLGSIFIVFVTVLITAIIHINITKKD